MQVGDDVRDNLITILRNRTLPLFVVLDAARDPKVLSRVRESGVPYRCLYEEQHAVELAEVAPYLAFLPLGSSFLELLVDQAWGKLWGVYMTSSKPLDEVRWHLRHFVLVDRSEGEKVFFRFYDPRILRVFLPTCTPEETVSFFGPITAFLMEGEKPDTLLEFTIGSKGARRAVHSLDTSG